MLDGQPIAFQRIAGSQFIRENDPLSPFDDPPLPSGGLRDFSSHPRAPHLRLVVSQHKPHTVHFADEQARELLSALDSGSVRPKSARPGVRRQGFGGELGELGDCDAADGSCETGLSTGSLCRIVRSSCCPFSRPFR